MRTPVVLHVCVIRNRKNWWTLYWLVSVVLRVVGVRHCKQHQRISQKIFGPVDLGTTMDELISFENIELEPLE